MKIFLRIKNNNGLKNLRKGKQKIGINGGNSYRKNEEIFGQKTQTHGSLIDTFGQ